MTPQEIEKFGLFFCETYHCWTSQYGCKRYSEYNPEACHGCPKAAKPKPFTIRRKNFKAGDGSCFDLDYLDQFEAVNG